MAITSDDKVEFGEATAQADTAIARLNALYERTGRRYRVRLEEFRVAPFNDLDDDDLDDLDDPADGDRVGSERAEREDADE